MKLKTLCYIGTFLQVTAAMTTWSLFGFSFSIDAWLGSVWSSLAGVLAGEKEVISENNKTTE